MILTNKFLTLIANPLGLAVPSTSQALLGIHTYSTAAARIQDSTVENSSTSTCLVQAEGR